MNSVQVKFVSFAYSPKKKLVLLRYSAIALNLETNTRYLLTSAF